MANKLLLSRYIIGLILIVFYQIIIAQRIALFGFHADLAIIFTVWIGLIHGPKPAAYFGFVAGILIGVINPLELGWAALFLIIVGYVNGTISNKLEIEPTPIKALILFISALFFNLLMFLFTQFELVIINPMYILVNTLVPAIYSALLGMLIFYIIRYRFVVKDLL